MENNTPNTDNFLNWVEIKNFKSIKDLRLDCKRVNVFIGKPNVGKSNILEGLGLLGASYSDDIEEPVLGDFIRFKNFSNLFYDDDVTLPLKILSDKVEASVDFNVSNKTFSYIVGDRLWYSKVAEVLKKGISTRSDDEVHSNKNLFLQFMHSPAYDFLYLKPDDDRYGGYSHIQVFRFGINENGEEVIGLNGDANSPIKRYEFKSLVDIDEIGSNYLLPPYGRNLFNVIDHNEEVRKDLAEVFRPNGLNLVLSKKDRKFSVQKQIDGYVYDYPYSNIADTFQRYAFYLAAIESNTNSVIVLEEPEVHSFPPYTQELTYRMIYGEENQFFVTTHSPYLLQTLIENLTDDQLNVFITYYENYETKVRALTADELREVMDFSIDIFYNLEKYQPNV